MKQAIQSVLHGPITAIGLDLFIFVCNHPAMKPFLQVFGHYELTNPSSIVVNIIVHEYVCVLWVPPKHSKPQGPGHPLSA